MRVVRRVNVGLEGTEVAKWLAGRIGAARSIEQVRSGLSLGPGGIVVLTSHNPIYKSYPPQPGEADVPYLGEDAYVQLAVAGRVVACAGSNRAIIDMALNKINEVCNGLADGADKVCVELEREEIPDGC